MSSTCGGTGRRSAMEPGPAPEYRILREVSNTDFLQAVTLLATAARRAAGGRRGRGRRAPAPDRLQARRHAQAHARRVPALRTCNRQRDAGRREIPARPAPVRHQVPAVRQPADPACRDTGHRWTRTAQVVGAQQKLARWYWCGVFGELYGGTTETRFSRDLPEVVGLDSQHRTRSPAP